jgi:hypothetical protein
MGECSLFFHPKRSLNTPCSFQINSLQLAADENGEIYYPYGYFPLVHYRETDTLPPATNNSGALFAATETGELIPGIAYAVGGKNDWPLWINKQGGWACLGEPGLNQRVDVIEFAANSVAVLAGSRLVAVWLHPESMPVFDQPARNASQTLDTQL